MIDEILKEVNERKGDELAQKTGAKREQIPQALGTISSVLMKKAKSYIDDGKVMELRGIFASDDPTEREAFLNEMKGQINTTLGDTFGFDQQTANQLTELSVPEIIQVSKEKLLGPDGKIGIQDFPKLMSFFKSEGKEVKSGFGGLFG